MEEEKEKKKRPIAKSISELKKNIQKEHGPGAVMQGKNTIVKVDSFPTGIVSLDFAIGCRGLPRGRVIEIFGLESSGKTTLCLHLIAACQQHTFVKKNKKVRGVAAFIDAEHAYDPGWAAKLGVDNDQLLFSQPDSGEEAFDIAEQMVESGQVDLIVIDSVANLVPLKELEGDIGDSNMGAQARLMSKGLRKLSGKASKSQTTVIFINQIRHKIGVMFGSPETTPGGLALKFYASIRGQISKGSALKGGKGDKDTVGFSPTLKFIKNKCAPPFTTAEFDICVGHPERPVFGVDKAGSLIKMGVKLGVIKQNGSMYSFKDQRLGNGIGTASSLLRSNQQLNDEIMEKIYGGMVDVLPPVAEPTAEEQADAQIDEPIDEQIDEPADESVDKLADSILDGDDE